MLEQEILLRSSDPSLKGVFILLKSAFLQEGVNTGKSSALGRCDNLTYTGILVSEGTEYANHAHSWYYKTIVSDVQLEVIKVAKFAFPIVLHPKFLIGYLEMNVWHDSEADPTPSTMWGAKSIFQLFKNMREWSFMADGPFNSDHPMATYSKLLFETLEVPSSILEEIDSLPDMHLAKFLKGEENYKSIPHPYPEVSQEFKDWITQLTIDYPEKSFEDIIGEL
jgi:hypothetical protein